MRGEGWRPLLIALGLLTRLPIPWRGVPADARELGQSVLYYPLVGVVIGLVLAAVAVCLPGWLDVGVRAALVLIAWVWLTGGLHLDGLADTADGWIGGLGDPARGLAIMKDPRSGPAAVVAVVLLLVLKWNLARVALQTQALEGWLIAPLLGRVAIVLLFLTTPYLRAGGMGAEAARSLPRFWAGLVVVAWMVGVGWWSSVWIVAIFGVVWFGVRRAWMGRFGGVTGDLAGASCEMIEAVVMLAWVWQWQEAVR
ncbi:MAG: adenosylcobinamide-GDP ribazoletransferase [Magnetococcus sp. YQC-9]